MHAHSLAWQNGDRIAKLCMNTGNTLSKCVVLSFFRVLFDNIGSDWKGQNDAHLAKTCDFGRETQI